MGSATRYRAFHASVEHVPFAACGTSVTKPGILRRIAAATERYRARQLDGEIADILARSGGRFTDSIEREIDRRITFGSHEGR
jgi:hypothetical protein